MDVKNLFEPGVKADIIHRINRLHTGSTALWGKMTVGQMLAHCQKPLGVATGRHPLKANFFLRLLGPLVKHQLYNDKPFARNLPTDPSFRITTPCDFDQEREKLIAMIDAFSPEKMSGLPHPFFGRLTNDQWSKGSWKHLDHHLRQFGV